MDSGRKSEDRSRNWEVGMRPAMSSVESKWELINEEPGMEDKNLNSAGEELPSTCSGPAFDMNSGRMSPL